MMRHAQGGIAVKRGGGLRFLLQGKQLHSFDSCDSLERAALVLQRRGYYTHPPKQRLASADEEMITPPSCPFPSA
jgi:hypothetical protein